MTPQMTDDDLDQLLRAATPPVGKFAPSAERRRQVMRGRSRLRARPWHSRWLVAIVPLASGAVAAALLLIGGPGNATRIETACAAARLLNRAADAAERGDRLEPGQLMYTRDIENVGGDGLFTVETWTRVDGSTARRVVTTGGRSRAAPPEPDDALPWVDVSEHEILALPSDPHRILAIVRDIMSRPQPQMEVHSDGEPYETHMVVEPYSDRAMLNNLMALYDSDLPLMSGQRAALLRAAALVPGVVSLGETRDALGRRANAIAIASDEAHEGYGRAYLTAARDGRLIGSLELRNDMVVGWYVKQQAVVGGPSERPLRPPTGLPPARFAFRVESSGP